MIPVLRSEEALAQVHVLQLGSGLLSQHDARSAIRRLEGMAEMNRQQVPSATRGDLADMGITVRKG